jgi:hypothetical protein
MAGANDEHRGAARSNNCDTNENAVAERKCLVEIPLALFGLFILVGCMVVEVSTSFTHHTLMNNFFSYHRPILSVGLPFTKP